MEKFIVYSISFVVIIISLTFHEAAHAGSAYFFGDPTAKNRGRLSLNPLVHIDPFGTILLPILLAISNLGIFGWAKPVPVNPNNLRNPDSNNGLIALAGPAANFALAITGAITLRISILIAEQWLQTDFGVFVYNFLLLTVHINILLMLFNLLPIKPLDGSAVLEMFLKPAAKYKYHQLQRYSVPLIFILIFTNLLYSIYLNPFSSIFIYMLEWVAGTSLRN